MPSFFSRLKAAFAPEPEAHVKNVPTLVQQLESARVAEETAKERAPEMVGFSTAGTLHKAFAGRASEHAFFANCNLETRLKEVRSAQADDTELKRCGRCYPSAAQRSAPRRKTLARRSPELVYLVAPQPEEDVVILKAWFANEYGQIDKSRGLIAKATVPDVSGADMPPRDKWMTSKDTDRIYTLQGEVRDGLFQLDDAIREAMKGA